MSEASEAKTAEVIQDWLVNKVAQWLETDPDEVDPDEPFANFGLNSIAMVELSGDLEGWLGRSLSPTLLWDYPTIERIAQHLAEGS